jgi:hypothetical protein
VGNTDSLAIMYLKTNSLSVAVASGKYALQMLRKPGYSSGGAMGPHKAGGWWMNQSIFEVANRKDVFGYLNSGFLGYRDSMDLFRVSLT